jgi:hypothetical protein
VGSSAVTNFVGNLDIFSAAGTGNRMPFLDGTSNTVLFATRYGNCRSGTTTQLVLWSNQNVTAFGTGIAGYQLAPTEANADVTQLQSFTAGGLNVCMADVSTRTLSPSLASDAVQFRAGLTAAGGEVQGALWND